MINAIKNSLLAIILMYLMLGVNALVMKNDRLVPFIVIISFLYAIFKMLDEHKEDINRG